MLMGHGQEVAGFEDSYLVRVLAWVRATLDSIRTGIPQRGCGFLVVGLCYNRPNGLPFGRRRCVMMYSALLARLRIFHRPFLLALGIICVVISGLCQRPPKPEKAQTLATVPEAPGAVRMETSRLEFLRVPDEQTGLLSKQVEESMKSIRKSLRKRRLVRVTAWVAGAGDVRRVSSSIRELLADWRIPLPAITVVRVGALPNAGSRVSFDVELEGERDSNPNGLIYLGAVRSHSEEFTLALDKLLAESLDRLQSRLQEQRVEASAVLSARCLVSLTDDVGKLDDALRARFPGASTRVMQSVRVAPDSYANCDVVARLPEKPTEALEPRVVTETNGAPPVTSYVKVNTPQMVLTAGQLCFRSTDDDLMLGFERLEDTLKDLGTSLKHTVQLSILAQSPELEQRTEAQGRPFLQPQYDPAILRQTVEALPALDSTVSLDAVVAVKP